MTCTRGSSHARRTEVSTMRTTGSRAASVIAPSPSAVRLVCVELSCLPGTASPAAQYQFTPGRQSIGSAYLACEERERHVSVRRPRTCFLLPSPRVSLRSLQGPLLMQCSKGWCLVTGWQGPAGCALLAGRFVGRECSKHPSGRLYTRGRGRSGSPVSGHDATGPADATVAALRSASWLPWRVCDGLAPGRHSDQPRSFCVPPAELAPAGMRPAITAHGEGRLMIKLTTAQDSHAIQRGAAPGASAKSSRCPARVEWPMAWFLGDGGARLGCIARAWHDRTGPRGAR